MNMKQHILAAMREQVDHWEELLGSMDESQITAADLPSNWSVKDVIAHLRVWQTRSIARTEAAVLDREPELPMWPALPDPDAEGSTDQINAWIYESNRELPWGAVYKNWKEGYLRLLDLAEAVSEKDMLDSGRYPWLKGYPLAFILVASYDHHQEHFEKLTA